MEGPGIDAEVILVSHRLLKELGLIQHVELQLNCLGSSESRRIYREKLVAFYQHHYDLLDEDSQRRLITNPLRILDSKNPIMIDVNKAAPVLLDHLDPLSQHHFDGLRRSLDAARVPARCQLTIGLRPRLLRIDRL